MSVNFLFLYLIMWESACIQQHILALFLGLLALLANFPLRRYHLNPVRVYMFCSVRDGWRWNSPSCLPSCSPSLLHKVNYAEYYPAIKDTLIKRVGPRGSLELCGGRSNVSVRSVYCCDCAEITENKSVFSRVTKNYYSVFSLFGCLLTFALFTWWI